MARRGAPPGLLQVHDGMAKDGEGEGDTVMSYSTSDRPII